MTSSPSLPWSRRRKWAGALSKIWTVRGPLSYVVRFAVSVAQSSVMVAPVVVPNVMRTPWCTGREEEEVWAGVWVEGGAVAARAMH